MPKPAIAQAGNERGDVVPSAAGRVRVWRFGVFRARVVGVVGVVGVVVGVVGVLGVAGAVAVSRVSVETVRRGGLDFFRVVVAGGGGGGGGGGTVVPTVVLGVGTVVTGAVTVVAVIVGVVVSPGLAAGARLVAAAKPQPAIAAARQPQRKRRMRNASPAARTGN
jgi:hypothetical protein